MNKYKHDEIIRAWLDGKTIQVWFAGQGRWVGITDADMTNVVPGFAESNQYRIKPNVQYRNIYEEHAPNLNTWHPDRESADLTARTFRGKRIAVQEDKGDGSPYVFHAV